MNVTVFCSSACAVKSVFRNAAWELGHELATRHLTVVHGGASEGLMGQLLAGASSAKGRVIGVSTAEIVWRERPVLETQEIIRTATLAERKKKMIDLADRFLILPGGFGTLDETCEIITRKQLGLTNKPISFINILGYWDNFFRFLKNSENEGMVTNSGISTFSVHNSVAHAMNAIDAES